MSAEPKVCEGCGGTGKMAINPNKMPRGFMAFVGGGLRDDDGVSRIVCPLCRVEPAPTSPAPLAPPYSHEFNGGLAGLRCVICGRPDQDHEPTSPAERFCPTCGVATPSNVHCGLATVLPEDADLYTEPPPRFSDTIHQATHMDTSPAVPSALLKALADAEKTLLHYASLQADKFDRHGIIEEAMAVHDVLAALRAARVVSTDAAGTVRLEIPGPDSPEGQ